MSYQPVNQNTIGIIYAGGTFGSYGKPLQTIDSKTFLPILTDILKRHFSEDYFQTIDWQILENTIVKDSSQLSPTDFAYFYELILMNRQKGVRQFVFLTGTDTLSYLSAFLAEAFVGSDICVAITGAMQPLLDVNNEEKLIINPNADASLNLFRACQIAVKGDAGIWVCFDSVRMAQTVSKLYSHEITAEQAFSGYIQPDPDYPQNQYLKNLDNRWLNERLKELSETLHRLRTIKIMPLYLMPVSAEQLAEQFLSILACQPDALILLSFGAGNVPRSQAVEMVLKKAYQQNCLVVLTTQCPFGGVSDSYQAGAWLTDCGVVTAGSLTKSAIFARLLWLSVKREDIQYRQRRWHDCLNSF